MSRHEYLFMALATSPHEVIIIIRVEKSCHISSDVGFSPTKRNSMYFEARAALILFASRQKLLRNTTNTKCKLCGMNTNATVLFHINCQKDANMRGNTTSMCLAWMRLLIPSTESDVTNRKKNHHNSMATHHASCIVYAIHSRSGTANTKMLKGHLFIAVCRVQRQQQQQSKRKKSFVGCRMSGISTNAPLSRSADKHRMRFVKSMRPT